MSPLPRPPHELPAPTTDQRHGPVGMVAPYRVRSGLRAPMARAAWLVTLALAACTGGTSDSGGNASGSESAKDGASADGTPITQVAPPPMTEVPPPRFGADGQVIFLKPDESKNPQPTGGEAVVDGPVTGNAATGSWTDVADWPVLPLHATVLPNGQVLTFGTRQSKFNNGKFYYSIWNPEEGLNPDAHMVLDVTTNTNLFCSSSILLPTTGKVLINGGDTTISNRTTGIPNPDLNVLDPDTGAMTRSTTMDLPRWYSTSTMLMNGEVFIQGGSGGEAFAEVYQADGETRRIDGWNNLDMDNNYPRNWLAPNGQIYGFDGGKQYWIDLGANNGRGARQLVGENRYDWGWSATSSAAMYAPGQIAVFGGGKSNIAHLDINGESPRSQLVGTLPGGRQWVSSTVLPNGQILVSGGSSRNTAAYQNPGDEGTVSRDAWLYNPETRALAPAGTQLRTRLYHSVTLLLPDGSVLSGGGGSPGPESNLNAQIYYPPYFFARDGSRAVRPVLDSAPATLRFGQPFTVASPDAARIRTAVLMKTPSVTHSNDMEQRRIVLEMTRSADAGADIGLTLPANRFLTPPGYYMLFLIDSNGVPSTARIIRLLPDGA